MDGVILLLAARAAGLTVSAVDGRLVIRGPKRLEPLALQLLAHKSVIMAALRATGPPDGLMDRPLAFGDIPDGWLYWTAACGTLRHREAHNGMRFG